MTTDNKTLADVQPGGRVRLGNGLTEAVAQALATVNEAANDARHAGNYKVANALVTARVTLSKQLLALSAQPSPGGQGDTRIPFETWAKDGGFDVSKFKGIYNSLETRAAWGAWLYWQRRSTQPSPGGQGDDSPMAKMAAALRGKAEAERAAFDQRVQSGEWGPMPDNPDVLELPPLPEEVDSVRCMIRGEKGFAEPCDYYFTSKQMRDYARTALAASQPVGEPVAWQSMATCPRDGTAVLLRWGEDHVSPGWWCAAVSPIQNEDGTWPRETGGFPWAFFDMNDGVAFVNHAVDTEYGPTHWAPYVYPAAQAVDLGAVRQALQAAEGLATICASVDGYSREEVAASGRAMKQQFADALAKVDSQAVDK